MDVEVDARITGTDMERWNIVDADDWLELVTRMTCSTKIQVTITDS